MQGVPRRVGRPSAAALAGDAWDAAWALPRVHLLQHRRRHAHPRPVRTRYTSITSATSRAAGSSARCFCTASFSASRRLCRRATEPPVTAATALPAPPPHAPLSPASAAAAHALCQLAVIAEVARGVVFVLGGSSSTGGGGVEGGGSGSGGAGGSGSVVVGGGDGAADGPAAAAATAAAVAPLDDTASRTDGRASGRTDDTASGSATDGSGGGGGGGEELEAMMATSFDADGARRYKGVGEIRSHDALCELMRWGDAAPKIELRFDDEAQAAAIPGLPAGFAALKATVLYPASFAALRERFCEGGDAAFAGSLRHAVPWNSGRGGKSGSTFLKTLDDRFVLKQVPRSEFQSFHEHAATYFAFVSRTSWSQLPSALVKILGAIVIEYRAPDGSKHTCHLLVQENLFYGKNVARMCDLKGAHRKRDGEDDDGTVVDEALFRFNNGYPLLLSEAAKQRLTRALHNDTLFLASINVMDYSLLVGMVQTAKGDESGGAAGEAAVTVVDGHGEEWTLMVGLIDYCRQFMWKEEVESRIKRATVIQPKQYKRRFRDALNRYFMASIDKYV